MTPTQQFIVLNLNDRSTSETANLIQGDSKCELIFSLRENGKPYKIVPDTNAFFCATKPDAHFIYNDCIIDYESNTVKYIITPQTSAAVGKVQAQLLLFEPGAELAPGYVTLEVSAAVTQSATIGFTVHGTVQSDALVGREIVVKNSATSDLATLTILSNTSNSITVNKAVSVSQGEIIYPVGNVKSSPTFEIIVGERTYNGQEIVESSDEFRALENYIATLKNNYVPITRTIAGLNLSDNITAQQLAVALSLSNYVPITREVVGLPLSSDITPVAFRINAHTPKITVDNSNPPTEHTSDNDGDLYLYGTELYQYNSAFSVGQKWVIINGGIPPIIKHGTDTPTDSTVGKVGQLFINVDIGKIFVCRKRTNAGIVTLYTWEQIPTFSYLSDNFVSATRKVANLPLSSDITVQQLITALGVSTVYKGTATYPPETNHIDGDGYWNVITHDFFVFYSSNAAGQKWVKINGGSSINIDTGLNHTDSDEYVLSEKAIIDNFTRLTFANTVPTASTKGFAGEIKWIYTFRRLFICVGSNDEIYTWKELPTSEAITSLLQNYVANNKIKSSYSTTQGDIYDASYINTELAKKLNQSNVKVNYFTESGAVYDVTYVNSNFAEKQDKSDSSLLTTNKSIVPAINEVNRLAKEKQSSKSFANYSAMIDSLQNTGGFDLNIGQSLYIKTLNVPDLWIYENAVDPKATYVYESDEKFLSDLRQTGTLQIGFYKVAELETQKVDLSEYVETNKIKSAYSTSQGAVYDVTYVNSALTNCIPKISNPDGSVGNGRIVVTKQDGTLNYTSTLASSLARKTDVPTVKSSYSTVAGEVYDVNYINSLVSRIEQLEQTLNME